MSIDVQIKKSPVVTRDLNYLSFSFTDQLGLSTIPFALCFPTFTV